MSVLTDAGIAANAHLEKVAPEAVEVNGVQMWYWSTIYDAFMAGAAFERERCAMLCESKQDLTEEASALKKSSLDQAGGEPVSVQLSRLNHLQTVRMWNSALSQAAAAIRKGG